MMGKDFENPWGLKTPKGETRMMTAIMDGAVFPGTQGGPLEHVIAAKAIAFQEDLSDEYLAYCVQMVKNARAMAKAFIAKGYKIISGSHQLAHPIPSMPTTAKAPVQTLRFLTFMVCHLAGLKLLVA